MRDCCFWGFWNTTLCNIFQWCTNADHYPFFCPYCNWFLQAKYLLYMSLMILDTSCLWSVAKQSVHSYSTSTQQPMQDICLGILAAEQIQNLQIHNQLAILWLGENSISSHSGMQLLTRCLRIFVVIILSDFCNMTHLVVLIWATVVMFGQLISDV